MTIYETIGNGTSSMLEIIDDHDAIDGERYVRLRIREGDFGGIGKASIFLTADELDRAAVELARLAAVLRSRATGSI